MNNNETTAAVRRFISISISLEISPVVTQSYVGYKAFRTLYVDGLLHERGRIPENVERVGLAVQSASRRSVLNSASAVIEFYPYNSLSRCCN